MKEATASPKDAALKLALEVLERYQVKRQDFDTFEDAVTTIKEALAPTHTPCEVQDELCSSQKPVAWVKVKAAHYMPWYDEKPLQAKLKEKNT